MILDFKISTKTNQNRYLEKMWIVPGRVFFHIQSNEKIASNLSLYTYLLSLWDLLEEAPPSSL